MASGGGVTKVDVSEGKEVNAAVLVAATVEIAVVSVNKPGVSIAVVGWYRRASRAAASTSLFVVFMLV